MSLAGPFLPRSRIHIHTCTRACAHAHRVLYRNVKFCFSALCSPDPVNGDRRATHGCCFMFYSRGLPPAYVRNHPWHSSLPRPRVKYARCSQYPPTSSRLRWWRQTSWCTCSRCSRRPSLCWPTRLTTTWCSTSWRCVLCEHVSLCARAPVCVVVVVVVMIARWLSTGEERISYVPGERPGLLCLSLVSWGC